jgi:hypothetical protein
MARIGSIAAAPFVGGEFVSLYLGATRVPTVPGRPAWDGGAADAGGTPFDEFIVAPANDGGSQVTGYNVYLSGEFYNFIQTVNVEVDSQVPGPAEIAVAAVNAVGEGPRLKTIYDFEEPN